MVFLIPNLRDFHEDHHLDTAERAVTLWKRMRFRPATYRSRKERGAAGLVVAVFVAAVAIGGYIGYSVRRSQPANVPELILAAPPERATTQPAPSTVAPLELPTTVETTLPPETVPPETAPPETQAQPVANLSLATDGTPFRQVGGSRIVDSALGCDGFTATAAVGAAESCERFDVGSVGVVWLRNVGGDDELLVDAGSAEGDTWTVAYSVSPGGKLPKVVDVTGDGQPELVYSNRDDARTLQLDVFSISQGSADLTLHLTLPEGKARADDGVLNVWLANGSGAEFVHVVLDGSGGQWRKTSTAVVDESAVGIGQF